MYKKFGYTVFRRVINYYSGEEDAYGASRGATVPVAVWSLMIPRVVVLFHAQTCEKHYHATKTRLLWCPSTTRCTRTSCGISEGTVRRPRGRTLAIAMLAAVCIASAVTCFHMYEYTCAHVHRCSVLIMTSW